LLKAPPIARAVYALHANYNYFTTDPVVDQLRFFLKIRYSNLIDIYNDNYNYFYIRF